MRSSTTRWLITVVSWFPALTRSLFQWCIAQVKPAAYLKVSYPKSTTYKRTQQYLTWPFTGIYGFHEDTQNKLFVVSMPLAHKKSSMIFIMPYHVEPLERLEKLLTRQQLDTWVSKLEERAVAISLPKVSMEVSHDLQVNHFRYIAGCKPQLTF